MPMNFLNLDLDFFVHGNIVHWPQSKVRRSSPRQYRSWTPKELIQFLEGQCGLSTKSPIPGRFGKHHDAVYDYWSDLRSVTATSAAPFNVVHVDAHADLGFGDGSWMNLCTDLLHLPLASRSNPLRGNKGLNLGSYIPYAVACQWISSIEFVTHPGWNWNDLPPLLFKNYDVHSGFLQLKRFARSSVDDASKIMRFFEAMEQLTLVPIGTEPDVPFTATPYKAWKASSPFDYAFLAQSPNYTPASADKLIGIFCRYIDFQ
jgi:hypothetical protein